MGGESYEFHGFSLSQSLISITYLIYTQIIERERQQLILEWFSDK